MIKGNIQSVENCYSVSEKFQKSFVWIKENDLKNIPDGRYDISEDIYANVQSYNTKDDAPYEAHKEYIDIQYMVTGEEMIAVAPYPSCTVTEEYDSEKDVEFLKNNSAEQYYKLNEGEFFIFFPHDAHKPSIKTDVSKGVKKVIVKVRV